MLDLTPHPPDWAVDWTTIDDRFEWIRRLRGVEQSPDHHGEGDVWTHTRMVCEHLAADPDWRTLEAAEREELFAAALLHDVAKRECSERHGDGRITAHGHSRRGAIVARGLLWRGEVEWRRREVVCGLVRHHLVPTWALERDDPERAVSRVAETTRWDRLLVLARADVLGRVSSDRDELLERLDLAGELARELGCLRGPRPFPSDHTRLLYYTDPTRSAEVEAYDDCRSTVTLMSGLPGTGKDTWLRRERLDLAVVSLDAIRTELGLGPRDDQGRVRQLARERAREHLRRGDDFAWNATSLTRQARRGCIDLFRRYGARVEIVAVEATASAVTERNRTRPDPVPRRVVERMLAGWEMPDATEAHVVRVV